jgi:hypothetical protein
MKKKQAIHQQPIYEYVLPGDAIKVTAMALAMGNQTAERDYPNTLSDRDEVETQARARCVILKNAYNGQTKQLTNDFSWFCELVMKWYTDCYIENAQHYELDPTSYEKDKQATERAGGHLAMYNLLKKDYEAQLRGEEHHSAF